MPRWNFQLIKGTLTRGEKDQIATQVTKLYTDLGIPAFLINVFFSENEEGQFYSGGKTPAKAVWFGMTHAARGFADEEERLKFHATVDEIVRPIFEPKGIKWEYNVYQYPGDNWRVDGMNPPISRPDVWKQWVDENRAVPYEVYN